MKILGIIPARSGSKGVPGKNIKLLQGKPLVEYTMHAAMKSDLLDSVLLSSDDEKCIAFAKANNVPAPFKRPDHLSTDAASSQDVILHTIQFYRDRGIFYDAICLLQPTSPFRLDGFIDAAIEKFQNSGYDSLFSVLEVPHEYNPHWVFKEAGDGRLTLSTGEEKIITRRQDLPTAYHRDGSIYLVKTEVLLNENTLYGKNLGFTKSDPHFHVNIDTMDDWEKAEKLAIEYLKL